MRLPAFLVVALGSLPTLACGPDLPPFQSVPVAGDPEVIARFEGRWYDYGANLVILIEAGRSPKLLVRAPEGFAIRDVTTRGNELHFETSYSGSTKRGSLRLLAEDVAVWVRPGAEPSFCGTCTPRYRRNLSAWTIVRESRPAAEVADLADAARDAAWDWLVDHL